MARALKKRINPWGCALWIVVGFVGLVWFFSGSTEKTPEDDTGIDPVSAMLLCRRAVEKNLVSPASAEHPWVSSKDVTHDLGANRYRVLSYVDSQNIYGVVLRTQYNCVVERSGETLKVISLETIIR